MGIESRYWYRKRRWTRRAGLARLWLAVAAVVAVGSASGLLVGHGHGYTLPYGLDRLSHPAGAGDTRLRLLPAGPTIGIDTYLHNDRWQTLLATERTCPGGESTTAPLRAQAQTMLCLVNYARTREGLHPLTVSRLLNQSSAAKAADIARCQDFRHDACGKPPSQGARQLGHRGAWGENLYMGNGPLAAPRVALDAWLNSPGHRRNLLRPQIRITGIAVRSHATASRDGVRIRDGVIWVNQFGT